jgi:hypothetical protein
VKGIFMKGKTDKTLEEQVREAIGAETLAALGRQPLALAGGGIETLLQAACKKCAGRPDAVDAAVRELRVSCGSKATPKPLQK